MSDAFASVTLRISSPVLILAGPSPAINELTQRLRSLDVKVLQAPSAMAAQQLADEENPHLLVCDARLARRIPDLDAALESIRNSHEETAVLAWFDADAPDEEVLGFCRPIDDHMAGSIAVDESLRRLHFLSGRLPERREGQRLVVGDLELDTNTRTVMRAGVDIDLSDTEFRLLRLLMRHARTVLPKSQDSAGGVGVRLRRTGEYRRALHQLCAQEDRSGSTAHDPHGARRRLCAAARSGPGAVITGQTGLSA